MALVDKDEKYKIVNENYVKAFGMPREEIVEAYCKDILPPNIWDVHGPLVKRALKGESPEFIEKTDMPDGSILYAAGRYVPIVGENGIIHSVTVYVDDVTNLKNAEDQLKLELKEKDKLFSIIAHDIRSPLNLFEGLLNASDNQIITQ
jgi:PAS domain S-box-containing protein